jgi:hypothetical protein
MTIENHEYAMALHYFHYNFIRRHSTPKTAPAVAAGIIPAPLTMTDVIDYRLELAHSVEGW